MLFFAIAIPKCLSTVLNWWLPPRINRPVDIGWTSSLIFRPGTSVPALTRFRQRCHRYQLNIDSVVRDWSNPSRKDPNFPLLKIPSQGYGPSSAPTRKEMMVPVLPVPRAISPVTAAGDMMRDRKQRVFVGAPRAVCECQCYKSSGLRRRNEKVAPPIRRWSARVYAARPMS